ncbi:AAA family ATPase [Methylocystis bryophila]|uniref:AAA+ ATPase domain-containing protein n=1 Tax=Methylocystis bryophila TaxID=655015 RepID=A0A1W6MTP2_9HYPH|nr:AAA family ATPase [Methylocystis bryophila]ARN80922.1 hypothetical protein B1812_07365 [Methylocystis bryophila]BDV36822.1 hypothetical protein DSM21852_00750 [Methylocystis bryophila]
MTFLENGFNPGWTQAEKDRWAAEGAAKYKPPANNGSSAHKAKSSATLIRCADVKIEAIDWLWHGWLARRKLHVLAGAPGGGKSTIAYSVIAIITSAGTFPDGSRCASAGNVVIWSSEDDPSDTIKPRLVAMGADVKRVYFVRGATEGGKARPFDPSKDMDALATAIADIGGVVLVIIDSIAEAVSGDSHKNTEARRGLQPVVDLAQSANAAVLGIAHFTKGTFGRSPIDRITGSLAFGAMARVVLVAAKNDSDEGPARIIARAKSNIGPDGDGFVYDLEQRPVPSHEGMFASCVAWGEALEGSARELLAQVEGDEPTSDGDGEAVNKAKEFISETLAAGPKAAKEVEAEAKGAGHSERTIRRAKKALAVVAIKGRSAPSGAWTWSLPVLDLKRQGGQGGQHGQRVATFDKPNKTGRHAEGGQDGQLYEQRPSRSSAQGNLAALAAFSESPEELGKNLDGQCLATLATLATFDSPEGGQL